MPITDYKGKTLLSQQSLGQIEKQADLLVQNKDVAGAYHSAEHLKKELSALDHNAVKPFLSAYRRISVKLKALALPLLPRKEVENLLENNLDFLDTKSEEYLVQGLRAYLASQPDEKQIDIKENLLKLTDKDSAVYPRIKKVLAVTEDDKELEEAAEKAGEIKAGSSKSDEIETLARQIYSRSGKGASEEVFVRRAKALIDSRLRDVRAKTDLAQYLSRPAQVGGLGLSGEALDFAQEAIEDEYNRVHKSPEKQYSEKQAAGDKPDPARARKEQKSAQVQKSPPEQSAPAKPESKAEPKPEPRPEPKPETEAEQKEVKAQSRKSEPQKELDNLIKADQAQSAGLSNILKGKKTDQSSAVPARDTSESVASGPARQSQAKAGVPARAGKQGVAGVQTHRKSVPDGKVRLEDIKSSEQAPRRQEQSGPMRGRKDQVKSYGLADELGELTLNDFRSLGGADSGPQKILSKLKVLEQESFVKKMDGIKKIRQSPLYNRYLSIGDLALSGEKKLAGALSDKSINPDGMTEDEFFAISDLNAKLK